MKPTRCAHCGEDISDDLSVESKVADFKKQYSCVYPSWWINKAEKEVEADLTWKQKNNALYQTSMRARRRRFFFRSKTYQEKRTVPRISCTTEFAKLNGSDHTTLFQLKPYFEVLFHFISKTPPHPPPHPRTGNLKIPCFGSKFSSTALRAAKTSIFELFRQMSQNMSSGTTSKGWDHKDAPSGRFFSKFNWL